MGNLVAVWLSDDPVVGGDLDIAVATSSDGGGTWSNPQPLNSDALTDTQDDAEPELATDGNGTWVAIWRATDTGSTITTEIRTARSTDNGATWSEAVAFTPAEEDINPDGADSEPHLATDGQGRWIAVWTSTRDIDGDLEPKEDEENPDVLHLTTDQDIFFATSNDGGESWGPAVPFNIGHVDDEPAADAQPSIATDLSGNWMVVWTLGGQIVFSRSEDGGTVWTAPEPLPNAPGTNPRLLNDGARETTETTGWFCTGKGRGSQFRATWSPTTTTSSREASSRMRCSTSGSIRSWYRLRGPIRLWPSSRSADWWSPGRMATCSPP